MWSFQKQQQESHLMDNLRGNTCDAPIIAIEIQPISLLLHEVTHIKSTSSHGEDYMLQCAVEALQSTTEVIKQWQMI